jgi:hypothetical protein
LFEEAIKIGQTLDKRAVAAVLSVVGIVAAAIAGIAVGFVVFHSPTYTSTSTVFSTTTFTLTQSTTEPSITITSLYAEWNGQNSSIIGNAYSTPIEIGIYGIDILWAFTANGQGFSPIGTFSLSSMTQGFSVIWGRILPR